MPVRSRARPVTHAAFLRLVRDSVTLIPHCKLGWDPAKIAEAYAGAALPHYATVRGLHEMNAAVAAWLEVYSTDLSVGQFETFLRILMSEDVQEALGMLLDKADTTTSGFSLLHPSERIRWVYSRALANAPADHRDTKALFSELNHCLSPAFELIVQLIISDKPLHDAHAAPAPLTQDTAAAPDLEAGHFLAVNGNLGDSIHDKEPVVSWAPLPPVQHTAAALDFCEDDLRLDGNAELVDSTIELYDQEAPAQAAQGFCPGVGLGCDGLLLNSGVEPAESSNELHEQKAPVLAAHEERQPLSPTQAVGNESTSTLLHRSRSFHRDVKVKLSHADKENTLIDHVLPVAAGLAPTKDLVYPLPAAPPATAAPFVSEVPLKEKYRPNVDTAPTHGNADARDNAVVGGLPKADLEGAAGGAYDEKEDVMADEAAVSASLLPSASETELNGLSPPFQFTTVGVKEAMALRGYEERDTDRCSTMSYFTETRVVDPTYAINVLEPVFWTVCREPPEEDNIDFGAVFAKSSPSASRSSRTKSRASSPRRARASRGLSGSGSGTTFARTPTSSNQRSRLRPRHRRTRS